MTFVLDQDVPEPVARVIEQAGHEAIRLRKMISPEAPDAEVLAFAHFRQAVLVSCNRDDFLALAQKQPHSGIVILVRRSSRALECGRFLRLLQSAGENGLRDNINFA